MRLSVQVDYLADKPDWLPVLAEWFYQEWGHGEPPLSKTYFVDQLHSRMNRDWLPITMVTSLNGVPIATSSLIFQEMETHPQYMHWLAGVYTHPQFRRRGVGSQTVEVMADLARRMEIDDLYLYTRHNVSFYARLGWMEVEQPVYRGRQVVIMRRELERSKPAETANSHPSKIEIKG
jgi:GNAT superfamily N-acetyltransferase